MKYRYALYIFFLLTTVQAQAHNSGSSAASIEFVENKGQWAGPFRFKAVTPGSDVYLEPGSFTIMAGHAGNKAKLHDFRHGKTASPPELLFHAYRVHFEGANPNPRIAGNKAQKHYYNYYLGQDPGRWKSGIHPVLNVDYHGLYAGIDLHVSSENGHLKYDFIVQPGADAAVIRLRYEGADRLDIKDQKLQIHTSVGTIEELRPYAYQFIEGRKKEVKCLYRLEGNVISYRFPDGYDQSRNLIIDPTVVFATFTGSTSDNWGLSATYDNQGNFYAGGSVSGSGYPVTTGAFQTTFAGGGTGGGNIGFQCDMAITKFNSTGTNLIYSTYVGGSDNDQPHSMVVDPSGNLIIAGRTYSNNFPVSATAFDNSYNLGADLVVLKLNSAGTALIGSTYMGGSADDGVNISSNWSVVSGLKHSYGDDARSEVITDPFGNAYVAAPTSSSNFPVTANAWQNTKANNQDGVVFKLNGNMSTLIWSTFIGGNGNDAAYVLDLDTGRTSLYVAGGTSSTNFPVGSGAYQSSYQGGTADGFILKFQNGGTYGLQAGTLIGTGGYDQCFGIQVDLENNVYAMGQTLGGTFPVNNVNYSNPGSSQFVIKLNNGLTTNVYSTVFGSGTSSTVNMSPVAFLVDTCQNVYLSGWGGGTSLNGGNITGMPTTANAFQTTTSGDGFYFIVFSKNIQSLLYGSYMSASGNNFEHVDGGTSRFDKSGVIYQGICGGCGGNNGFPTTAGSWSPTNGSSNCNYLAVKIAFELGAVNAEAVADPNTKGCPPFTVQFQNNSSNATSYSWNFNDGTPVSTAQAPTHTFQNPGIYNVRMIAHNPNACKTLDTVYLQIIVDSNAVKADFNLNIVDSCKPYRVSLANTSQLSSTPGAAGFTTYQWFFGDGQSFTGANPPIHNYADTGTYTIMLVMRDSTACNSPDTVRKTFTLRNMRVTAGMNLPDSVCVGTPVVFTNQSINAQSILWDFGDNQTSTTGSPVHTYTATGTYTITLTAINPNSCNGRDSVRHTIKVKGLPVADFSFAPVIPERNKPTTFTNKSTGATSYQWDFGDGSGSIQEHPVHQYKRTGRYKVCLIARTTEGCADTVCRDVESDIHTMADIPSAFSPNGDGANDILYVRGGAIETINLRIFNRWGEQVFESNDLSIGWDGTYKGREQEMDAYAYVLHVTFIDGSTFLKKGSVTLLR